MDIILDIETVRGSDEDYDLYCETFPSKKKAREAPALNPCTNKIVAVGIKPLREEPIVFVGRESDILENTKKWLKENKPNKIITFNGTAFDFPVLRWRAAKNHISGLGMLLPDVSGRDLRNYDIFLKIKWAMPMSLSEISLLLFGKPKETDGNEIEELYKNGNVDEIVKHNILDLEITEAIYLMRDDLLTEGGRRF